MSALDLDALERLLAEAEPSAPWRETKYGIITDDGTGTCVVSWDYAWGDAEGVAECTLKPLIVAAVNALPALITRLRATESERDDLRCEAEALQAERDTARLEAGRLRARLRAAEARTAWQPIESVPSDATVLLWWPGHGVVIGHVPYDAREAPWRPRVYTHWQPLPAAPEAP